MTRTAEPPADAVTGRWSARPPARLLADQLAALDAWNAARRRAEQAIADAGKNREAALDARRRAVAVRREAEAVLARSADHLRTSGDLLHAVQRPRALVVHRQAWLREQLTTALRAGGAEVLGVLDDGAEGVAWAVTDQPDLLLVEQMLPTVSGLDVVRRVRAFAPATVVAVQVGYEADVPAALEAGAHLAVPRRVPPADLAAALLDRLRAAS